jgi:hypothetical protein
MPFLDDTQTPESSNNSQFEINDCTEVPWSYAPNSADLIHTRIANGFASATGPNSTPRVTGKPYPVPSSPNSSIFQRCLKPGGYIESQEFDLMALTIDDSLPPSSAISYWCELMDVGARKGGMELRLSPSKLKTAMISVGFEDVTIREFKLPIGLWSEDRELQEAGKLALGAMLYGLHGISVAIFTRLLMWDVGRMEILLAQVRREWRMKRVRSYWPV